MFVYRLQLVEQNRSLKTASTHNEQLVLVAGIHLTL